MNKLSFLALSALVVTAGVSATSCSSDEVVVENNPTFDGKAVKTDFAINIPVAGGKASRQSVEVTQAETTPVFKGMKDIYLASMVDATPGAASTFTSVFRLPNITNITETSSAKIYNDVEVPVGTKGFVFYGTSAYTGVTETENYELGVLENNLADNSVMSTAAVKFNLKPIVASVATLDANKNILLNALNGAVQVANWGTFVVDAGKNDDAKLKKLHTKLTKVGVKYLGSAAAIKAILVDLDNSLNSLRDEELSDAAKIVKTGVKAKVAEAITAVDAISTFPESVGLPQGALQIESDGAKYSYVNNDAVGIGNMGIPTGKINFPASLNYTVSTKAKTKNEKVTWLEAATAWGTQFGGWDDEVVATTRTIALEKNIQYSVARLDVAARLKTTDGLPDNADAFNPNAAPQRINSGKFKVTGVIIGGQPTKADWQVLPIGDDFTQSIYDRKIIDATEITTEAKNFCKTLVLDNKKSTGTQNTVNVALELVNGSGVDFYGLDGVIKAGAKFYLVAQLNPGSAKAANGQDHVFVQDHVTKATFTLTPTSLPNAYVGIPDLPSSDLELGLSVDLKWEDGMVFEIDF